MTSNTDVRRITGNRQTIFTRFVFAWEIASHYLRGSGPLKLLRYQLSNGMKLAVGIYKELTTYVRLHQSALSGNLTRGGQISNLHVSVHPNDVCQIRKMGSLEERSEGQPCYVIDEIIYHAIS